MAMGMDRGRREKLKVVMPSTAEVIHKCSKIGASMGETGRSTDGDWCYPYLAGTRVPSSS